MVVAEESGPERKARQPAFKPIPFLISIIVGTVLWFLHYPQGISLQGGHVLALFLATILGCILNAAPLGLYAFIDLIILTVTHTVSGEVAFSGYSDSTIWLIVAAYCAAVGFTKTGLGLRIAYLFVKLFGKRTLTLGYALVLCELVISPAIPSNTARGAGIIFPIIQQLAKSYGSDPKLGTSRKIGSFLVILGFHANLLTSAIFLTAISTSPIAVSLADKLGVHISWGQWALAGLLPAVVSLVVIPLFIYLVYKPEITKMPEAPAMAQKELEKMGPVKRSEIYMLISFLVMILLWIFGNALGVSTTIAAFIGVTMLVFFGVIKWSDIPEQKSAWKLLVWLGPLLMMGAQLNRFGVIKWFSNAVGAEVHGLSWGVAFVVLGLIYYYSHYFFTSLIIHVNAFYTPFLAILIGMGAPPVASALYLAFLTALCAQPTNYGTLAGPLYFSSEYVSSKAWFSLGFAVSALTFAIWTGLGMLWWHMIGIM
ncbi:DASS family sodium-coupled anion symporter [Bacillus sp. FSL M8-0052]|uniref:DASS family sodium-coupled anion symporter n=1 Tax=Bacillus TaxID=1386 RepID=UPI0006175CA2|nr:DASS family sodium-coupled anion symporter [Bacillus glycinifermentans]WKB78111.1 DASS family sodium-coupled anion symporter [Bacillus glycinifermentans]